MAVAAGLTCSVARAAETAAEAEEEEERAEKEEGGKDGIPKYT